MRTVVVFPAPFGPNSASTSPFSRFSETSSTAVKPSNCLHSASASIMMRVNGSGKLFFYRGGFFLWLAMSPDEPPGGDQGSDDPPQLVDIDPANSRNIQAQELQQETPQRIPNQVDQENVACFQPAFIAPPQPEQDSHQAKIPQRLIQK